MGSSTAGFSIASLHPNLPGNSVGVRGAYSESAAEKAYPNCEAVPCEQFDTAFEIAYLVWEVKLALKHCLMASHGVKLKDIKRVISHPQALAQCEHTLWVGQRVCRDTASAAKHMSLNDLRDTEVVASATAAKLYDLDILAENIQEFSTFLSLRELPSRLLRDASISNRISPRISATASALTSSFTFGNHNVSASFLSAFSYHRQIALAVAVTYNPQS